MSEYTTLEYAIADSIATITINRPHARNALNRQARLELIAATQRANQDSNVRVAIITGQGAGFCAGADLSEDAEGMDQDGWGTRQLRYEFNPIINNIMTSEKPFIAAVNGAAAGFGASLALACDLLVMADDGYLYSAFANIGLTADGGLHKMLSDYMGSKKAYEMIAFSQKLNADDCLGYGMANRKVAADQLMVEVLAMADALAAAPPLTLRFSKLMLKESKTATVEQIAEREAQLQNHCIRSNDFLEGMAAFAEKRKPKFTGK